MFELAELFSNVELIQRRRLRRSNLLTRWWTLSWFIWARSDAHLCLVWASEHPRLRTNATRRKAGFVPMRCLQRARCSALRVHVLGYFYYDDKPSRCDSEYRTLGSFPLYG